MHSAKSRKHSHNEKARRCAELSVALAVLALGLVLLVASSEISFGAGYDRIGPRFFPNVVGAGLLLLAGGLAFTAIRGRKAKKDAAESPPLENRLNWFALGYLSLALLLNLIFLETAGFVIASSLQFWLVARAFHSKRPMRDALVAVMLSAVVYFAFSRILGLTLPSGVFEGLF